MLTLCKKGKTPKACSENVNKIKNQDPVWPLYKLMPHSQIENNQILLIYKDFLGHPKILNIYKK